MSVTACVATFGLGGPSAAVGLRTATSALSPSASTAVLMAASGAEEASSAIPWGSVGPGWFVALWTSHAPFGGVPPPRDWKPQASTLYLVDPLGGRYRVAVLSPDYQLFDWAGDRRRVLVGTPATGSQQQSEVEDVDLGTGRVLHHFTSSNSIAWYQYTRPEGLAILASAQSVGQTAGSVVPAQLVGHDPTGLPAAFPGVGAVAPDYPGGVLPSLDGTAMVVQASRGMALVANDGTLPRRRAERADVLSAEVVGPPPCLSRRASRSSATGNTLCGLSPRLAQAPSSSLSPGRRTWATWTAGRWARPSTPKRPARAVLSSWHVANQTVVRRRSRSLTPASTFT